MMTRLALRLFGIYFRDRRKEYSSVHDMLMKADMRTSVEAWLSLAALYASIIALLFLPIFVLASRLGFGYFLVWDVFKKLLSISPQELITFLGEFLLIVQSTLVPFMWSGYFLAWNLLKGVLTAIPLEIFQLFGELLLVILAALVPFFVSFLLFYQYPKVRIWERKRKIEGQLPYAIGWMSSLATVGVIPYEIFKKLAETEEYYGEVSKEAKRLVRDVEILGFDFLSALRHLAAITPSERFRVFLQGAITSSLSGGEMGSYFVAKARENMEENRRRFADFITTLGMLSELYITGLVAGPLFIIVMFSAMMMVSGASPALLQVVIYGVIPLGSVLFILLTDSMTPQGIR